MILILAVDLMDGLVVHGTKGQRETYTPLTWGLASSAAPTEYVSEIKPKYLYIADLDRIEGRGEHDSEVRACAGLVKKCFLDRGCRSPADILKADNLVNIVATETAGRDLSAYNSGFLSVDMKDRFVIPGGEEPASFLSAAESYDFEGCIILNLGAVGTECGVSLPFLIEMRASYSGPLFYGGGVSSVSDLITLEEAGFDGAIISTALHRGAIPLEWIREGEIC